MAKKIGLSDERKDAAIELMKFIQEQDSSVESADDEWRQTMVKCHFESKFER